ncbi:hypothetical protein POVCU1_062180 [Plasmodium ovale curtisi]|uniref:Uncharacterized protein n=1 Tax=Plasmodium ovale curtisi TaxID=864141 RepID=A0A1A8X672_PLAOA|nr:hypothetical protein POVCU1_062180 [Plasmodium ovale curtisi]
MAGVSLPNNHAVLPDCSLKTERNNNAGSPKCNLKIERNRSYMLPQLRIRFTLNTSCSYYFNQNDIEVAQH